LCCSFVCCIQGYILFAINLGFEKHGPLASSKAGEVFGSAAEVINQRKRYDQALTLFDDDKEEEHLAQKTSATSLTKKSVNTVPAAAAPSTSKKNSSTNPPETNYWAHQKQCHRR
jgi:hypothetical protein